VAIRFCNPDGAFGDLLQLDLSSLTQFLIETICASS
jgi:hypothetical protein